MIPLPITASSGFTFSAGWRGFELKQNDQIIATLRRSSAWSSNYVAEASHGKWVICREGFWGNKAEVRDQESQQPIAKFRSAWGGEGRLIFADGQTFQISERGFWRPVWIVTTEAGQPVLQLRVCEKSVEVQNTEALPPSRLSLLILFTFYRVRQAEEAAVVASAAAS